MKFDVNSRQAVARGAGRYVVGEVDRFHQKNEMFNRGFWDPSLKGVSERYFFDRAPRDGKAGYGLMDTVLRHAGYHLEYHFGKCLAGGREGLYAWDGPLYGWPKRPAGVKLDVADPSSVTRAVKKAARLFGAALVGVCKLDRRWLYSHSFFHKTAEGEYEPVEIPEEYQNAVVMAVEMDYESLRSSPTQIGSVSYGLGYSQTAFTTGLLAQFIRGLGFKAIPMGNDTALSIPLAIDAGLGELSRMGLLVTEKYGPRVRLCKIFTDLPLVPDQPVEFGVWDFCLKCHKCAESCPSQAIRYGEPTAEPNNICNRSGILRWPINAEKCFRFWAANTTDCGNCIRSCPFNKPPGRLHDLARWGVKHTRRLDPLFLRLDNLFGYGKQSPPERFWE